MFFRIRLLVLLLLLGTAYSQENDARLTAAERIRTLQEIQILLKDNYIFPDIAQKCDSFLQRQIDEGAYPAISHPRAFIKQLNTDLVKIHHDRHLRVSFILPEAQRFEQANPDLALLTRALDRRRENYGIETLRIFPENIGYLELTAFEPLEMSRDYLTAALRVLENSAAMIIDLRHNSGGNLSTVQFLSSHFIEPPDLLFSYYWRRGDYLENFNVLQSIPGRRRPDVPLFILIGPNTFSAAEEFAFSMQARQRALVIGERSGGGANPGFSFDLSPRFSIFIPTGRAVNPVTGSNWEGKGVTPDVPVVAGEALQTALERARPAARSFQNRVDDDAAGALIELSGLLAEIPAQLTPELSARLDRLLNELIEKNLTDEWTINSLGYRYLHLKYYDTAIALFRFNTARFPGSANAFDSLGEAYFRSGNIGQAQKCFETSLSIDPGNQNARYMLELLQERP
jgi:tetratricopeptide (TPR) repeat protein